MKDGELLRLSGIIVPGFSPHLWCEAVRVVAAQNDLDAL